MGNECVCYGFVVCGGLIGTRLALRPQTCLIFHRVVVWSAEVIGCGSDGSRQPPPVAVPPGCGWWQWWWLGARGRSSKPPRLGQIFAHSSVSTAWRATCFQHPLKQMFSLDLAPWYLFPCLRSIQIAGWLGWGPWPPKTCPRCPVLRRRLEAAPLRQLCGCPEEAEGPDAPGPGREGAGPPREARQAAALTVHRQKRVLCRASEGASPLSGRLGPGRLE